MPQLNCSAILPNRAWFIGSDNAVHVVGLRDEDGNLINSATVAGVLLDNRGNVVSGDDQVVFTYGGNGGDWDGVVPANPSLRAGAIYHLVVTVVAGGRTLTGRVSMPAAWYEL